MRRLRVRLFLIAAAAVVFVIVTNVRVDAMGSS